MNERRLARMFFLAYTFPPVSTGSGPRCVAFSRCMPEGGWTLIPVVAGNPVGLPLDESLLDSLPEDVLESRIILRDPLGKFAMPQDFASESGGDRSTQGSNRLLKMLRSLFRLYVLIPDKAMIWSREASRAVVRAAPESGARMIMSFGPPHSCHLAAMRASRRTGLPWVAHFGDLWTYDSLNEWQYVSAFSRMIQRRLESRVVLGADGILTTSASSSEYFERTYGGRCPPTHFLPNGYDPQILSPGPEPARRPGDSFTLTYTGFFMGTQTPEYFFEGLRLHFSRRPSSRLRVRIVGDLRPLHRDMPKRIGIADRLDITGQVSFARARDEQMAADALMVMYPPLPGSEVKNPTKLAEYLLARRSILAIVTEGELSRTIEALDAGYSVPQNPELIAGVLARMEDDWSAGRLRVVSDMDAVAEMFDMRQGCRRLGLFLDQIASRGRLRWAALSSRHARGKGWR